MRRLPTRLPMHSMCRGLATQPSLLTFGEVMLTYKPAPGAEPIATGVSHVVQAVGGSELNVAAAYAQLDGPGSRSSSWVSILPEGPMGDLVMSTADTLGVATEHVQRAADSDIGTLHVVDDGSGPRPHFQRRQSAFCTQSSAETFPWSELLAKPNWYFLSGITPLLTAGARAAWNASLDALPAASSAGTPPYVCLDVNYRPALGSFDDLWAVIKPQLSRVTFLMLSGDTLEKLATAEGCWEAPKADETLYDVQVKALSAVRDRWGVPLVGCSFKRPVAADAAATGGGRQKTVIFGGGTRRWSTVAFEGGVASTAEMPIEHAPIQALGGGDAWMAGFIHCLNSRAFAGCAAYPLGELTSLLQAACRRGDLIAAMHMRTHGDMSSVQGAELFEVEASCAGKPHVVPPLPEPTATSTIAASGEGCGLPTAKWDAVNASLNSVGIVPVVTIQDLAHAVPVAKALVAGGINCIELTLRSEVMGLPTLQPTLGVCSGQSSANRGAAAARAAHKGGTTITASWPPTFPVSRLASPPPALMLVDRPSRLALWLHIARSGGGGVPRKDCPGGALHADRGGDSADHRAGVAPPSALVSPSPPLEAPSVAYPLRHLAPPITHRRSVLSRAAPTSWCRPVPTKRSCAGPSTTTCPSSLAWRPPLRWRRRWRWDCAPSSSSRPRATAVSTLSKPSRCDAAHMALGHCSRPPLPPPLSLPRVIASPSAALCSPPQPTAPSPSMMPCSLQQAGRAACTPALVPTVGVPSRRRATQHLCTHVLASCVWPRATGVCAGAWQGPYGGLQWMPTGGISPTNCTAYLQNPNILCVGGSWLVPASALESGDYGEITKRAQEAVEIVKAARGK